MNERELFIAALQLPADARAAHLDHVCAGDRHLRRRLEDLLRAYDQAESAFGHECTTAGPTDPSRVGPAMGAIVADKYKLIELLGEGGMGAVYMAQQLEPVKRLVAVKLIKAGLDSKHILARFETERQALAIMDHPNIAKVLDAGTGASGPFFVMELVKGAPITRFCDERRLTPRERLELFIPVCQAIQHAHQKGVIHRDIKPSNVLIALYDGRPTPKVIDFGVAKAVGQPLSERTLVTGFGALVGTLEYMSPEQAEMNQLDIDTRSDVYALGVLLYELLTGTTPLDRGRFTQAAILEMLRVIREVEPPKPSTRLSKSESLASIAASRQTEPKKLAGLVSGDLDWIVMKALEKDRTRRYESAGGFARDIDRYLHDQPVEACPPGFAYRAGKFLKRNKEAVVIAACVLFTIALAASRTWSNAKSAALRERLQTELLADAVDKANSALNLAVVAPIGRTEEWVAARAARRRVEDIMQSRSADSTAMERAQAFVAKFDEADNDRRLAAQIEETVINGATHSDLKSWTKMEADFRALFRDRGLDLDTTPPPEVARRIRTDKSADKLSDALELWIGTRGQLAAMGGPKLNAEIMQPWADCMYAADPTPVRNGLRRLLYSGKPVKPDQVEAVVSGVDLQSLNPRTLSWMAAMFYTAGDSRRADDIFQAALTRYPSDFMLNFDYGYSLASAKRWNEAIRLYNRCVALRPNVAGVWRGLGVALRHTGELPQSKSALLKAVELQPEHAPTWVDLALTLLEIGEHAEAARRAEDAIKAGLDTFATQSVLGRVKMKLGDTESAMAAFRRCAEMKPKTPERAKLVAAWMEECLKSDKTRNEQPPKTEEKP